VRLSEVEENKRVVITKVLGHGSFRRRISEMGFVAGKEVIVLKNAPLRDPVEYQLLGYNVSLRRAEAYLIEVITPEEAMDLYALNFDGVIDMEVLKTSAREKGKMIHVALAGNPNCGKTTLFNRVTNSKEHVGNYSGVTVDAKIATFDRKGYTFKLVDLPGTYSLTTFTPEELFARNYIIEETPDIILNVVDGTNLERNMFLTTQLIDMDIKVVIALNMYDDMVSGGAKLESKTLGQLLGIPIIPTMASKGVGLDLLFDEIIEVYEDRNPIVRHIHINYGEELERSIKAIRKEIKKDKPIIATMGEASAFKSGREFCAWLGLVPKQTGSGGKVRLGNISKRGDTYMRTLLIHGARSVLHHVKDPGPWLQQIKERRPGNVVIVAQAAKMARTIWAVTAKEQDYQRGFKSVRPLTA
jgi:ferrous iron transport protein B